MLWQAFLWGLGGSCGAAFGLLLLYLLLLIPDWLTGRAKQRHDTSSRFVESLAELRLRNELTVISNKYAMRIAVALEAERGRAAEMEQARAEAAEHPFPHKLEQSG